MGSRAALTLAWSAAGRARTSVDSGMIALIAGIVAILVFFGIGYALGRMFL